MNCPPGTAVRRGAAAIVYVAVLGSCAATATAPGQARNVILMIGDGMDEQQITLARDYVHGAEGGFAMEQMPRRVSVKVQTVMEAPPHGTDFIADSANTATSIATGELTSQGRLATSAGDDRELPTIVEQAWAGGLRTGIVTTARVTDATPAAFVAHVSSRECEGPRSTAPAAGVSGCPADLQSAGGRGSIAEQLAASKLDLLFGGGAQYFAEPAPGAGTVAGIAQRNGFRVLHDARQMTELQPGARALGLFARGNLAREWSGENARVAETIALDAQGKPRFPQPFGCVPNIADQPPVTLEAMTRQALRLLETDNPRGFLLVVEGASIDKAAHDRDPCGEIGELQAFDRAVKTAREFVAANPDTLLIVTADHAQAGQVVGAPALYREYGEWSGRAEYNPGFYAVLRTPRGELLGVSYATNAAGTQEELHTGGNVPAYIEGPGSARVPILIAQRELYTLMHAHLGLPMADSAATP
ncbi:MAG: alkaline phosphatase [Gammaproteobacteria bacterium]|nr:alkaline phosphatase [Gammaproteobacteria bacterium]MBP6052413.1 alkaline phosphatase [Pseudomonadales bacterium]MBK6583153.1 alkaline phosphatase [Gammaproteobacteria bacterium]MBK7519287.1 alkaline phosphatase [Gammaproteobacteria bacterium]MBK7729975.1 alkaline phosphatase [Gammaproteobacteria bacterium]